MTWYWNNRTQCWITSVAVAGHFALTRERYVNNVLVSLTVETPVNTAWALQHGHQKLDWPLSGLTWISSARMKWRQVQTCTFGLALLSSTVVQ
jgi:hypothetical protein